MSFIGDIRDSFYALENSEDAQGMREYMRNQYPFLGIKKPERALVFKQIYQKYGKAEDWFEVSSELFAMPEREWGTRPRDASCTPKTYRGAPRDRRYLQ